MPIVGGLDIHRKQLTFDYLDTSTGEVKRGQVAPADRVRLRAWLARFTGREVVAFALEVLTALEGRLEELRHELLDAARHLAGARVLAARLYGVGPLTALAMTCWLGGACRSPPPARPSGSPGRASPSAPPIPSARPGPARAALITR